MILYVVIAPATNVDRFFLDTITPFGFPEEPLVYIMYAGNDADGAIIFSL